MGDFRCSSSTSIDSGGMYGSLSRVLRMRRTKHERGQEKVAGISNSTCSGSKTRRDCLFFQQPELCLIMQNVLAFSVKEKPLLVILLFPTSLKYLLFPAWNLVAYLQSVR